MSGNPDPNYGVKTWGCAHVPARGERMRAVANLCASTRHKHKMGAETFGIDFSKNT